jgi:hypothetical protein
MKQTLRSFILVATLTLAAAPGFAQAQGPTGGDPPPPGNGGNGSVTATSGGSNSNSTTATTTEIVVSILLGYLGL